MNERISLLGIGLIALMIVTTVFGTTDYFVTDQNDNLADLQRGLIHSNVNGYIDYSALSNQVTEWEDAASFQSELFSDQGSIQVESYEKYTGNWIYVGMAIPATNMNMDNLERLMLQIDTDGNNQLSNGDIRLVQEVSMLYSDMSYLQPQISETIQIYQSNSWLPLHHIYSKLVQQVREVVKMGLGSQMINEEIEWNVEAGFSPSRLHQFLAEIGISATEKDKSGYSVQFDLGDQSYSQGDKLRSINEDQVASEKYRYVNDEFEVTEDFYTDVRISKVRITQAIQNETEGALLVQNEPTHLKVGVERVIDEVIRTKVIVTGYTTIQGTWTNLGSLEDIEYANPPNSFDPSDWQTYAGFDIPSTWLQHSHILFQIRALTVGKLDYTPDNNEVWSLHSFYDTHELNIFRVAVETKNETFDREVSSTQMNAINDGYRFISPGQVNYINLEWSTEPFDSDKESSEDRLEQALTNLAIQLKSTYRESLRYGITPVIPLIDQIHGTTSRAMSAGSSTPYWSNNGLAFASWGSPASSSKKLIMAHEIYHNILPTPTARHNGGCGADNSDTDWISRHGNSNVTGDFGWSSGSYSFIPDDRPEIMTYCAENKFYPQWISIYRWNRLVDRLRNFVPGSPDPRDTGNSFSPLTTDQSVSDDKTYVLTGRFEEGGGSITASLDYAFTYPAGIDSTLPEYNSSKPYRLEIEYIDGQVEYSTLNAFDEGYSGHNAELGLYDYFILPISTDKEITRISVNKTSNNQGIGDLLAKPLDINKLGSELAYSTPELQRGENITVNWNLDVTNTSILEFKLQYSHDNQTWYPVSNPTTDDNITVELSTLPGSEHSTFRLLVSNGLNTSIFYGPEFNYEPKPPGMEIPNSDVYLMGTDPDNVDHQQNTVIIPEGNRVVVDPIIRNQLGLPIDGTVNYLLYHSATDRLLSNISTTNGLEYQLPDIGEYEVVTSYQDPTTSLISSDTIVINVISSNYSSQAQLDNFLQNGVISKQNNASNSTSTPVQFISTKTETFFISDSADGITNTDDSPALPFVLLSVNLIMLVILRRLNSFKNRS